MSNNKNNKQYWLVKSEPSCYSIDDLHKDKKTHWDGVRNYQARNLMKEMRKGDEVLFYHSNADPKAVVGTARVCKEAYPDHTAWDKKSDHPDPKSTPEHPIWYMVDVCFVQKFKAPVTLVQLKLDPFFEGMELTRRGSRLSVQPVPKKHFEKITVLGEGRG